MKRHRFQNKVAGSEFTLPVCAILAAILWWWPEGTFSLRNALGLMVSLLTTYFVMETNARQHIIRIRTRMMSCVWLVLSTCLAFMHPFGEPIVAAALLSVSYMLLFRCYQRHRPQAYAFHAFLMLSMGSFCTPIMLLMAVPFFLYLVFFLRNLTSKTFWAGIVGLIAPYWCYAIWCFATNDMPRFLGHLSSMIQIEKPCLDALVGLPFSVQASAAVIALLSIVGIVNYLRNNYNDKIRVRMILYIYVAQTLLLMALLLLQPTHYQETMALLVASASPLIAHYFSLTGSILSNLFFILSLLLTAAMATLNLWMTSFSIY